MSHKHVESQNISEQVREFLASGNEIKPIPRGVGKDNPFPTETHRKAQANGAKSTKHRKGRWHGAPKESKSKRWNDGAVGVL